jgi:hypothetical protein
MSSSPRDAALSDFKSLATAARAGLEEAVILEAPVVK